MASIHKAAERQSISKPALDLPKLSQADFSSLNRIAVLMDYYHNHFRRTWNTMHTACENKRRPAGMSIRQFLNMGSDFCHHLTMHHTIEEQHFFPVLATKMPAFQEKDYLLKQHEGIHEGVEKFEKYLDDCRAGEKELRLEEMKGIMDSFGEVLWAHLDDEVKQLGADNMRLYWTANEVERMPF